ncbi:NUDIX hydrolase [Vagococcus xieshaowenii]|uniref:NUDIX hydrolase n=1 Tax=Vagococcus xieshaowenii TaxID=2562451 RepID=A0AAJ5EG56_9ENTE|nr:NUDIX hydrolase [Vagococcus xieshaowenii]QCA28913.1 NUDIX hydrolase [Vagococcus xieshaowenii]TFZ43331.1 NUDIX hydrolase [Vagococcus xieshaowenii]
MREEDFYEKTLHREMIFKGRVIEVAVDEVVLADGTQAQRELVFHHGAVGIVPVTSENNIILVKQFRKPIERTLVEIPAGKIEKNEHNPIEVARRELEEETGLGCQSLEEIFDVALSPGFSNERMIIYLATGLVQIEQPKGQDEDERIELLEVTLDEAKAMITSKEINDSKTIMAIQYLELNMK